MAGAPVRPVRRLTERVSVSGSGLNVSEFIMNECKGMSGPIEWPIYQPLTTQSPAGPSRDRAQLRSRANVNKGAPESPTTTTTTHTCCICMYCVSVCMYHRKHIYVCVCSCVWYNVVLKCKHA